MARGIETDKESVDNETSDEELGLDSNSSIHAFAALGGKSPTSSSQKEHAKALETKTEEKKQITESLLEEKSKSSSFSSPEF